MRSRRIGVLLLGRFALLTGVLGCSSSSSTSGSTGGGSEQGGAGPTQGGAGSAQGGGAGTLSDTAGGGGSMSGGGGGTGGSAGVAGQAMTPEAVCRAAIEAQCEVKARCGAYSEVTLCTIFSDLCPEYYFSPASTRTVESVSACLDALRNKSCQEEDAGIVPTCLTPGTLAEDAPCSYSSECASGACFAAEGSSCKTCQHEPGPGEACETSCALGNFCHPTTMLCTPVVTGPAAAEGEPCNVTGTPFVGCQGELGCASSSDGSTPVCRAFPGEGEPCPEGFCATPLICHLPEPSNPICSSSGHCTPSCPAGSRCASVDGGGMCVPFAQQGDACDETLAVCAPGLMCRNATCVTQPRRGDPCEEGDCPSALSCTNRICSLPATCG